MKTKLLLVVMMIPGLSGLGHAQSLSHYNWRPINEIGAVEIQVIEMIIRRSAVEILSSAKSFTRSNNTLIIVDKVGVWHFFASGSMLDSVGSSGGNPEKVIEDAKISEVDKKQADDSANLDNLYQEFFRLWIDLVYVNTRVDIREVDLAAQAYFVALNKALATHNSFPIHNGVDRQLERIASKGNRYFGSIEPILKVMTAGQAVVDIYGSYINAEGAIISDKPSSAEVVDTLHKIGKLAISNPDTKINYNLLKSMEVLTPDLYQRLAK